MVIDHALEVLEFRRVLERVAARASSELGRERVLACRPSADLDEITSELSRVGAAMRFLDEDSDWAMESVPDVSNTLRQLSVAGAVLEAEPLHRVGVFLASSRSLSREFSSREGRFPELATLAEFLVERRDAEESIARCVDAEGHVLDTASKELKRLRSRLKGARSRIVHKLEGYLGTLTERFVVPDGSVTIREGRFVIPVRREGKREVGGIVHDESQSGATLFIEPPMAVALTNELRDLEREEAREVRRVLAARTAEITPYHEEMVGALSALVEFDALFARARTASGWRAAVPDFVDDSQPVLVIREGRHPLLVDGSTESVVSFDLDLGAEERVVVVSGPNTGGKSVFLKATGLICALAQSGVVPPVGKGTRLRVFDSFFADIGDEQSIAQSLSTFSAHLANLGEIVTQAGPRSLVLIDEMGTGTDPAEGASLSRAVLDELVSRRATALVSSHLGDLKRLDTEGSGIVNASLQFDPERMEPTYRFVQGRPGRSYGLAIARRLGFPAHVLDRAEALRDDDESRMEEILARLELREREAEKLVHELDLERAQTARLIEGVQGRERTLKEAEKGAGDRARGDARRMLLDARSEVEAVIEALRASVAAGDDFEESARQARRTVEKAVERHAKTPRTASGPGCLVEIEVGQHVRIHATGARGRVMEVRSGRATVETGGLRLEIPTSELEVVDAPAEKRPARGTSWQQPQPEQGDLEIDLRGQRVDEMELELSRALDHAVTVDLAELRIIHGKGTGALRQRVGEILALDARVREFHMGSPVEGGAGVTIANFKGGS